MACTRLIHCGHSVLSVDIAPNGQQLAIGFWCGGVVVLDVPSCEFRGRLAQAAFVSGVAFSPACTSPMLLAIGSGSFTVQVWDCVSGARVADLQGHMGPNSITFSPDGRLLASGFHDDTVRLWRTGDWDAPPTVLRGHTGVVDGVSFSCDSRLLASCSVGPVQLWRILDQGADAAATAAGPAQKVGEPVCCVAFSPVDSRLLACGGKDGFLVLARVSAGDGAITVERKLQGHTEFVRGLAFSPCGQKLASASNEATVRLWSVASGTCLRVLRGHTSYIRAVAFGPDGMVLASGSDDKTVRLWTLETWSDKTHHFFGAPFKEAVFTLMCVRARLEKKQKQKQGGQHALQLPRLPMEVWLLVFEQLQQVWIQMASED